MGRIVILLAIATLSLTGCATILAGRSQTLTVQTNPPGATCELTRDGRIIGSVNSSPGAVTIDKTKHDISVLCKKPGYQDATAFIESGSEGATFANILAGGGVGWAIDSAAGADNKYADVTTITLSPVGEIPGSSQEPQPIAMPNVQKLEDLTQNNSLNQNNGDIENRLKKLEDLRTKRLITEDEYKKSKATILGSI